MVCVTVTLWLTHTEIQTLSIWKLFSNSAKKPLVSWMNTWDCGVSLLFHFHFIHLKIDQNSHQNNTFVSCNRSLSTDTRVWRTSMKAFHDHQLRKTHSSVQFSPSVQLFVTSWTTACQASLSVTNSWSSPKPMSIESVMPSNYLILCRPLLLLPSIFPSIRVFSNESALRIRWPKYWSFSFNISPSNEYSGLISFRMDWLDLLAVQGTLKSLLQHHSSKALILWHSAFFIVQLSHPYITTGKTISLTRQIFVDKVMSLLFNMLSRLVIKRVLYILLLHVNCGLPILHISKKYNKLMYVVRVLSSHPWRTCS